MTCQTDHYRIMSDGTCRRHTIEAALSKAGTSTIGVVVPYEGIYVRDHWDRVTDAPWWYAVSPDLGHQLAWRRDVIARTQSDWFLLPTGDTRQTRERVVVRHTASGAVRIDRRTGSRELLQRLQVGGWTQGSRSQSVAPEELPSTFGAIDRAIPSPKTDRLASLDEKGSGDLAAALLAEFGESHYPIRHVHAPLWRTYRLWGFQGMMTMIAERPDLVEYACERYLALALVSLRESSALGAAGIWIEDCMTDVISPQAFGRLNVPVVRRLVDEIRALGMQSIHYFCGDPSDRWDELLSIGADALSLEESKKGFDIDIEEVVERVQDRCALLGNLDAVGVLQDGSEDVLRREIARQLGAGQRNGGRFVMSLGSPVTPATPVERVRLYCELARELGRRT